VTTAPLFRRNFKALADLRIEEAQVLLASGKLHGAYYLAGYSVECALKACIAKKMKRFQFPAKPDYVHKLYTHKLKDLMKLADLESQWELDMSRNKSLEDNWLTVKDWTEESRYSTARLPAKDMYNAVSGSDGVLPWIKLRW
jgi:HEPN domain-containing protein